MRSFLIIALLLSVTAGLSAQDKKWTLDECISYALKNNIQVQRQQLETETARASYLQSKMNLLPTLNAGSEAKLGFGRSIDPVTNLITFEQNLSNYYYVSSELVLFNGFANLNTLSASKFLLLAGMEKEKIARNTLVVDILGQYYQIIYAKGLENSAKMQLELSEAQLFRVTKMVETGREPLSKQYEIESAVSADRLAFTTAHNSASEAMTKLRQMLQLGPGADFDLLLPDMNGVLITDKSYNTDSIFAIAIDVLPTLRSTGYELRAAKKELAAARGGIYPTLTAGGSIYTGYYRLISEDAGTQLPFEEQLKNNNSQSISLALYIPLFNNYVTGKKIKLARIRKSDTELRLQNEKNVLYASIENACLDYNRGRDEYLLAVSNLEFNRKSFEGVQKKFEAGLVDVTGYTAAKTALFKAENEVLRTKLQLIIQQSTMCLYSTGEYESLSFN